MTKLDNKYLEIYKDKMKKQLLRMHPDWDEDKLDKKISKIIDRDVKNPEVILDNNYIKKTKKSTLLTTLNWEMERKPILAGNGTFYKQHSEIPNPNAIMVRGFLNDRKQLKKLMFDIADELSRKYKDFDLFQNNKKKLANSYYGCSGAKTSPFYSKWSAIATTATAQSAISTTMTTFEAFLVDNFIFIHFNECIEWLDTIINEDVELDDWVVRVSKEKCYKRVASKCLGISNSQKKCLRKLIYSYTDEEVTRIYWKNNLHEFTKEHSIIRDLHDKIFRNIIDYEEVDYDEKDSEWFDKNPNWTDVIPNDLKDKILKERKPVIAWNNYVSVQKFYDPNKVPDTIIEYLESLKKYYMKYVYVKFVHCDRIYRLKNFKRKCVTVIDTDSNILSLDTWMDFSNRVLMKGDYGRSEEDNVFVSINAITYVISAVVNDILLYFGECSNVEESIRPLYNMKNEFYFDRLIIAKAKKRYLSRIILREGHKLKKPKYDVKGFDFKKAGVSKEAKEFYMKLIKEELLDAKVINLTSLMNKLNEFRHEVINSIKRGETTYLPHETAKESDAYDDPSKSQAYRGLVTWNMCEPDKALEFPVNVSIIKLNINKEDDILPLKNKNEQVYNAIMKGVFNDKTKTFIKKKKNHKGEYNDVCIGMNVLAIPPNDIIPEWVRDFIDYRTIVNNVLSPFKSVTEIFDMPGIDEGETGKKTTGLSNIIRL